MNIIRWTLSDIPDLQRYGIVEVLTEIDSKGSVLREIGLRSSGEVNYIAPTIGGTNPHGFFDGAVVDLNSLDPKSSFSKEEFEHLWNSATKGN